MMVTGAKQPDDPEVTELLQKINTSLDTKQKIDTYNKLVGKVKDGSMSNYVGELAVKSCITTYRDVDRQCRGDIELISAALQALGFFIHESSLVELLPEMDSMMIIIKLWDVIQQIEDRKANVRALWCLARQNLPASLIRMEFGSIVMALDSLCERWEFQVPVIDLELANVLCRLLEQVPDKMEQQCFIELWAKMIPHLVAHSAPKVRERGLVVMEMAMPFMMKHQKELVKIFIPDLKASVLGNLKKLFVAKQEVFVMRVWSYLVQLLGTSIHHGSFINSILGLVEQGFKCSSIDGKIAAFEAWKYLIDNFATNPEIMCDNKRVKLMMMVFKNNNAKVENLALVKLHVWWHFITNLGDKVSPLFDQTCVPLLHFALGLGQSPNGPNTNTPSRKQPSLMGGVSTPTTPGSKIGANVMSPGTPHLNLSSYGSVIPTFHSVQLLGLEIISHFLGKTPECDLPKYTYTLDSLLAKVVTSAGFFAKHCGTFMNAVKEAVLLLGDGIPVGLLYSIWYSLVAHCKNVLTVIGKKEGVDTLTSLLLAFQQIVNAEVLEPPKVLKILEVICCLPPKVLSSQSHHVGNAMHGTPALLLLELLLTPTLVEKCSIEERFFILFEQLIEYGFLNQATILDFSQSVSQLLDKVAGLIEDKESIWRLWSMVVRPLTEHIMKTNEVNQGDSLEHNFSCMYAALMLPITKILPTELPQPTVKTLLKTWMELYKTFARLSALVTNAEGNICCEELCAKIIGAMDDVGMDSVQFVETLSQISHCVAEAIDFSSFSTSNNFGIMSVSPVKWTKRKQKPLGNLHSLVKVTEKLLEAIYDVSCQNTGMDNAKQKLWQLSATNTIAVLDGLFSHVTQSTIVSAMVPHLLEPLAAVWEGCTKKTTNKLYSTQIGTKLEKLWQCISSSLQTRFTGPYDTDFLETVSPILEVAFVHPKRQVRQTTTSLWNATFANAAILKYPDTLRPCLMKVKEKTPIILPGWQTSEVMVIDETPVSQVSMLESQAPIPDLPGISSPLRMRGSFLNKAVSPNVKNSPLKFAEVQSPAQAKRKLKMSVNELKDDDFVVIAPSPKKKMLLTEHQKEVLKTRKTIPALYSSLDASQDVSLSSQFFSTTSQTETSLDNSFSLLKKGNQPVFKKPGDCEKVIEQTSSVKKADDRKRLVKFADEDDSCHIIEPETGPDTDVKSEDKKQPLNTDSECVAMETDDSFKIIESSEKYSEKVKLQDWELDMNGCFEADMESDVDATQEPSTAAPSGSTQSNPDSASSFQFHASCSTLTTSPRKIVSSEEVSNTSQVTSSSQTQGSLSQQPKFFSQPFNSENLLNFDCPTMDDGSSENTMDSDSQCSSQSARRRSNRRSSIQRQVEMIDKPDKRRKRGKNSPKKQVFGVTIKSDAIIESSQSPKKFESFGVFGLKDATSTPSNDDLGDRISGSQPLFSESPPSPSPTCQTLGKPPAMVLVEETQSPEKFKEKFLKVGDAHNDSIQETPVKELDSEIPKDGSPAMRVLFDMDKKESEKKDETVKTDESDSDETITECPEDAPTQSPRDSKFIHVEMSPDGIVISSAESKLNATPVVKLKKLTNDEINSFSPQKQKESKELKHETDDGFVVPSQDSAMSSQGSRSSKRSKKRGSRSFRFSHGGQKDEMDDLAALIESDDFVPSSQGFDLKNSGSSPEFTAIKQNLDEKTEVVNNDMAGSNSEINNEVKADIAPEGHLEDSGESSGTQQSLEGPEQSKEDTPMEIDHGTNTTNTQMSVDVSESVNRSAPAESDKKASKSAEEKAVENNVERPAKRKRGRPCKVKANAKKSSEIEKPKTDSENIEELEHTDSVEVVPETMVLDAVGKNDTDTPFTKATKKSKKGNSVKKKNTDSEDIEETGPTDSVEVVPETMVQDAGNENDVGEDEADVLVTKKTKKGSNLKKKKNDAETIDGTGLIECGDIIPETLVQDAGNEDEADVLVTKATKKSMKRNSGKKKKLYSAEMQAAYEGEESVTTEKKKKKKIESKVYDEDIFNRKCNLDVENDSDDDVPLGSLSVKKKTPEDLDEDLPLMSLVKKTDGAGTQDSKLCENVKTSAPESCDLFDNESEAVLTTADQDESQTTKSESTKKKKNRVKSELNRLSINMAPGKKATRSQKLSERVTKLGRRTPRRESLSKKKAPESKIKKTNEKDIDDDVDIACETLDENEDAEMENLAAKVDSEPSPETGFESDTELEEICQQMPEYQPEVKDLISRPILQIPELEKIDEVVLLSASPGKVDVPSNDLQETPRSTNKQARFMLSRSKTSSPKFVRSRGMRLLELASQSATKIRPGREMDLSGGNSTPKNKSKQAMCMTDPIRRHRLSRVDLILAKSKEILAKRDTAEEPRALAPNSSSDSVPQQEASNSPDPTGSGIRATMSPVSFSGFRTIQLNRIYSPSASPSAGILKKRKLCDVAVDSPSPPNKQRRVSFAESVDVTMIQSVKNSARSSPKPVNRCLELPKTSPLVSTDSRVGMTSAKYVTAASAADSSCKVTSSQGADLFTAPRAVKRARTLQASPSLSPMSCQSTQESELDTNAPFYPDLTKCADPVGDILPKITTSVWSRGLGNMMKARNISTIGDLCNLSEYDIHQLPLKTPKLETLRTVLKKHFSQWEGRQEIIMMRAAAEEEVNEAQNEDIGYDRVDSASDPVDDVCSPMKELPSADVELETLSPSKDIVTDEEDMDTTIEMAMESSTEALQNVAKLEESVQKTLTDFNQDNLLTNRDSVKKCENSLEHSETIEFTGNQERSEDGQISESVDEELTSVVMDADDSDACCVLETEPDVLETSTCKVLHLKRDMLSVIPDDGQISESVDEELTSGVLDADVGYALETKPDVLETSTCKVLHLKRDMLSVIPDDGQISESVDEELTSGVLDADVGYALETEPDVLETSTYKVLHLKRDMLSVIPELNVGDIENVNSEITVNVDLEVNKNVESEMKECVTNDVGSSDKEMADNNNNLSDKKQDETVATLETESDSAIEMESPPSEESENNGVCKTDLKVDHPVEESVLKVMESKQEFEFSNIVKTVNSDTKLKWFEILSGELCVETLSALPTNTLDKLRRNVNGLNDKIFAAALKSKCGSSNAH